MFVLLGFPGAAFAQVSLSLFEFLLAFDLLLVGICILGN